MPDYQFMTREAATAKATTIKAALATGAIKLYKSEITPGEFTTLAQLEAAECDFDGYPTGGVAITAWTGPVNFPGGGAVLTTPLATFVYGPAGDPPVGNSVGGWWIEDTAGGVFLVGVFDPPRVLGVVGDGITIAVQDVEGRNPPIV